MTTDTRVSCPACQARLVDLNGERAETRYDVGNPARPQMGHAMCFAHDGRVALCIARTK